MKKTGSTQILAGILIAGMGGWVLLGWGLHHPTWVQIRPEYVAMVVNTALCFVLLGTAFLLPLFEMPLKSALQRLLGWLVVGIAGLVLLEILLDLNFGIDWQNAHAWLPDGNSHPGRMAPNTAIGFILAGLTLVLSQKVTHKVTAIVIQIATFTVLLLGLTGLVGYSLQLELLYSWFKATRMALPTAFGMILVGLGLWSGWRRADWYKTRQYFKEDEKIAFVGAALLIVAAVTTGVAGFAAQQSTLEKILTESLSFALKSKTTIFNAEVNQVIRRAKSNALRPRLILLVQALNADPQNQTFQEELNAIGRSLLLSGTTGVVIRGPANQVLVQLGRFSAHPAIQADLGLAHRASLLWDRAYYLNVAVPIRENNILIGTLEIEEPLPLIRDFLMKEEGLGHTGEVGLCAPMPDYLLCYPTYRQPKIFKVKRVSINQKSTPMSLAVRGKSGVFRGLDYRGRNVIAAYVPLTTMGLGLVFKKDTEELFQSIRQQLQWSIPLLLLLTAVGAALLRAQITPLAYKLLRSEREATENELRIRTVMEGVAEGIITLDEHGIMQSFNSAASSIFGYTAQEALGQDVKMLMPPDMRAAHDAGMARYLAYGEAGVIGKKSVELPGLHKDGTTFRLELAISAIELDGRSFFVGIVRDITQRKMDETALFAEKERLRVTLGSIGDGVITTDPEGCVTYVNPVGEVMTGWTNAEAVGKPLLSVFNIVNTLTNEVAFNPVELVLRDEQTAGLAEHTVLIQRGGAKFSIEDSAAPIRDKEGHIIGVVLVFHDVSQARLMATEMTHQATHDALTSLINRREFERRLELAIQSGKLEAKVHTLLYLDLDQFKIVNDTCGHVAGDELLRQLTSIMQGKLRQSDTLARMGGDEFGVLLESCATEPALRVAEVLRQTVSDFRFVWLDKAFPIGVSIGLVTFSNGGVLLGDVLRMADAACYVAKDKGRNRVHVYTQEDTEVAQRQGEMGWIGRIQKALDEDRFVLYSQKILSLAPADEGEIHYEVLLRMKDEDGTLIAPMAFIPAAERYGLMPTLDRWVIRTTFANCAARVLSGEEVGVSAINLSGMSICDEHFLEYVLQQFDLFKVAPNLICFEITETAAIINLASAAGFIRELKNIGCRFSLDDFGSGMSSFAYLKHLSVDYLKIDGAFVKDMLLDPIDCAMVEAINHIGHVMGIQTIAEFVENNQIQEKLREIGVDFAQGYGVEKPHPL